MQTLRRLRKTRFRYAPVRTAVAAGERAGVSELGRHRRSRMLGKACMLVLVMLGAPICAQEEGAPSSTARDVVDETMSSNSTEVTQNGHAAPDPRPSPAGHADLATTPDAGHLHARDEAAISDEELRAAIEAALASSGLALDDADVQVENGVVSVSGTAKSWRMKEDVSKLLWYMPGVTGIVNDIELNAHFSVLPFEE